MRSQDINLRVDAKTYKSIKTLAEAQGRTIKKQLAVVIEDYITLKFLNKKSPTALHTK